MPDRLQDALAAFGLRIRGVFAPEAADAVPAVREGVAARALVLVGHAGSSLWSAFVASEEYRGGVADPLDRWSRRVAEALAERFEARALYPFGGPPHHPFQRWAARAEALQRSPLGLSMHPDFGLWHAYRFALAFADDSIAASSRYSAPSSVCLECIEKPCLDACPAGAAATSGFKVECCDAYLRSRPDSDCRTHGCRARRACPIGLAYRYETQHARFHMRAYLASLGAAD